MEFLDSWGLLQNRPLRFVVAGGAAAFALWLARPAALFEPESGEPYQSCWTLAVGQDDDRPQYCVMAPWWLVPLLVAAASVWFV